MQEGEALLDECTGHLFSAHVHYVIGFKNWWLLVSHLLNGFIHFLAPSNSEKANWNWLLIVISKSLNCGHDFSLQVCLCMCVFCKSLHGSLWVLSYSIEVTANLKL